MKKILLFCLFTAFYLTSINAQDIIGLWKTIDDETGKAKSVVKIYKGGDGKYYGKITKLFREPSEDQDPLCTECSGTRKDKKIIGMIIITGLEKKGSSWSGGKILDPANGKEYGCTISISSDGNLDVRGYLGVSALGRTQVWMPYTE
jgi:uncharacterized protein (DUF2147 family)